MPLIIIIQSDEKEKIKCKTETICNEEHGQFSGLSSVASFVPFGCSSRLKKPPFHSPLVSIAPASPEKGQAVTTLPRPHLHTVASFVRRGYYIHNTASLRFAS
jgi:hypothetical protein